MRTWLPARCPECGSPLDHEIVDSDVMYRYGTVAVLRLRVETACSKCGYYTSSSVVKVVEIEVR